MMELDFILDDSPWDALLQELPDGATVGAAELLTCLEEATEEQIEDLFLELAQRQISPDISTLPRYPFPEGIALRLKEEQQWVEEDSLLTAPGENDPLGVYLRELAQIPAAGDPRVLAEKLLAGDRSACDALVNGMLSRVLALSCEYVGMGVLLLDLIQEGSLGLWQGLQHYTGGDIEAYCERWIRHYLSMAVIMQARAAGVGQHLRQSMEDYRGVDERLLGELGRNPTLEEIAEAMHTTAEEAQIIASMVANARALNRAHQPEPEELPQEEDQAVEDTAYFQMRQRIADLLSGLSETDVQVLTLRYGLEGGVPMDAAQVGEKLGMTAKEVNEREAAALMQLRQ